MLGEKILEVCKELVDYVESNQTELRLTQKIVDKIRIKMTLELEEILKMSDADIVKNMIGEFDRPDDIHLVITGDEKSAISNAVSELDSFQARTIKESIDSGMEMLIKEKTNVMTRVIDLPDNIKWMVVRAAGSISKDDYRYEDIQEAIKDLDNVKIVMEVKKRV